MYIMKVYMKKVGNDVRKEGEDYFGRKAVEGVEKLQENLYGK